jgi:hypothetical protein
MFTNLMEEPYMPIYISARYFHLGRLGPGKVHESLLISFGHSRKSLLILNT